MERIGKELLEQSKAASMGTGEKGGNWVARDLLSLLVKANMSEDVPVHQRMSDADVVSQVPTFITAGHETTRYDSRFQSRMRQVLTPFLATLLHGHCTHSVWTRVCRLSCGKLYWHPLQKVPLWMN